MPRKIFYPVFSKFVLLLSICLFSFSVLAQKHIRQSKHEHTLTLLVKHTVEAQSKFDSATLEKTFAPDITAINRDGSVSSRNQILRVCNIMPVSDEMNITYATDEFSIRQYENFAVVTVRITLKPKETGSMSLVNLRAITDCRKEKDIWQIIGLSSSDIKSSN